MFYLVRGKARKFILPAAGQIANAWLRNARKFILPAAGQSNYETCQTFFFQIAKHFFLIFFISVIEEFKEITLQ